MFYIIKCFYPKYTLLNKFNEIEQQLFIDPVQFKIFQTIMLLCYIELKQKQNKIMKIIFL